MISHHILETLIIHHLYYNHLINLRITSILLTKDGAVAQLDRASDS